MGPDSPASCFQEQLASQVSPKTPEAVQEGKKLSLADRNLEGQIS